MTRRSLQGVRAVGEALDAGAPVRLVLAEREPDAEVAALVERAEGLGIPLWRGSEGDLRRMGRNGAPPRVMAMLGPAPVMDLEALLAGDGLVWVLAGTTMPSNAGFAIRTAEVSGAAGIIIDAQFSRAERSRAEHVSMGAHRLLPVLWESAERAVQVARETGRRVVVVEDVGTRRPWEVDLVRRPLVILGCERTGVPDALLCEADATVSIPMGGFVPSYNLQAAMSMMVGEALRQGRGR